MNDLLEEYIYRQLLRADVDVKFQESKLLWETRKMRPDMIVRNGEETMVLDTKWKIVNDGKPSDEDLRQVFAYNIYWKAMKGFLIYPQTPVSPKTYPGEYHQGHKEGSKNMTCQVVYVDVVDRAGKLNPAVGVELKEKISTGSSKNEVD